VGILVGNFYRGTRAMEHPDVRKALADVRKNQVGVSPDLNAPAPVPQSLVEATRAIGRKNVPFKAPDGGGIPEETAKSGYPFSGPQCTWDKVSPEDPRYQMVEQAKALVTSPAWFLVKERMSDLGDRLSSIERMASGEVPRDTNSAKSVLPGEILVNTMGGIEAFVTGALNIVQKAAKA
jgi:hypothetical protein